MRKQFTHPSDPPGIKLGFDPIIKTFYIFPIEGTPLESGIKAGDLILSIDDISTKGMVFTEAVKLIKGKRYKS